MPLYRIVWIAFSFTLLTLGGCKDARRDEWRFHVVDNDAVVTVPNLYGVNLNVQMVAAIRKVSSLDPFKRPARLSIIADRPDAVEIQQLRLVGIDKLGVDLSNTSGEGILVQIKPTQPGFNRLRFLADNTSRVGVYSYEAKEVTSTELQISAGGQTVEDAGRVFAGSAMAVSARYRHDRQVLRGSSPFFVSYSGDGLIEAFDRYVPSDVAPQRLVIGTNITHDERHIELVDETAIAGIDFTNLEDTQVEVVLDETVFSGVFVKVKPLDDLGDPLYGVPAESYEINITGESVQVSTVHGNSFNLKAVTAGVSVVEVNWGGASRSFDVTVYDETGA